MMIKELLNRDDNIKLDPKHLAIIHKSILVYGKNRQLLCFVEELGELLEAFYAWTSFNSNEIDDKNLIEEIVDVVLSIENIKILYGFSGHIGNQTHSLIPESVTKLLIAVSHYDRYRMSANEYMRRMDDMYSALNILIKEMDVSYSVLDEMWNKKFEKFERQLNDSLKNL